MLTVPLVPFYYIRHGETDWNVENRAMGQADIPLNANGVMQAVLAREHFTNCKIATICHSPLLRAKQTATLLNETFQVPLIENDRLREFNLGSYQGKVKEAWFKDWRLGVDLPGAESYKDFIARASQGIIEALGLARLVLIVAHGGVYWALEQLLQSGKKEIPNCAPVFCEPLAGGQWSCNLLM